MTPPSGFFGWVAFILEKYWPLFLNGACTTLVVAIAGTVLGFALGLLVAIARSMRPRAGAPRVVRWLYKLLHGFLGLYIEVFRGTPMMVQAMVINYGFVFGVLKQNFGIVVPTLASAIFIVTINTGSYMAEIVRGGIISVDPGQTEAAHSIGLSHWQTMTSVVLPQAIRNIMPSIGNEFIVNIKDSSVLNVISVAELYFQGKSAAGSYGVFFEVFFVIAMIYLFLTYTITRILRLLEKKMDGPEHYQILGSQSDSRSVISVGEVRK